jgi:hypothetical protein
VNPVLKKLENIMEDENNFFVEVRFLEGCNKKKLNEVLEVLAEAKSFYANTDRIPKYFSALVMDMEPVLWCELAHYPETVQQDILLAIDKLSTAIQDCFS